VDGEVTQATRRLETIVASSSDDATQALAATQAIPQGEVPPHMLPDRTQSIPPARRRQTTAAPARKASRRRWGNFVAGLAVLAAGVLVAIAILQASGSGSDNNVSEGNVHDQAQALESYIRDNSR
jgi:ferric-dicitrate binding protein FerR (iron transport regulator)